MHLEEKKDFIREIIANDFKNNNKQVFTRFPPEPNGCLHIGHAKAICLNFEIAKEYKSICNLRMDDTNPTKEETQYIHAIQDDIRWLGYDWNKKIYYASDYFDQFYNFAVELIKQNKAYIDSQNFDELKYQRENSIESPHRNRTIDANLSLFQEMRNGLHPEGRHVLRAKIDMKSPNFNMRDPVIYRIMHAEHHRTENKWKIYPMYDFAHPLSDAIENITHSLCTLEFENHRPLYDWVIENTTLESKPRQIEFSRLNLSHTLMSKRFLRKMVEDKIVSGWDDPRLPTLIGFRRRGYTPTSIKSFCSKIGITKFNSITDILILENCLREELNQTANRYFAILNPLKVTITNLDEIIELEASNNPNDEQAKTRKIYFSNSIYIERDDFMLEPTKKFFRLAKGREVRLRYAFFIKCNDVILDKNGNISEILCSYDPLSKGGKSPDGRKVKATMHWLNSDDAIKAEFRLYDRLFKVKSPKGENLDKEINENSLKIYNGLVEPEIAKQKDFFRAQFERIGYFCPDKDSTTKKLIYNQIVALRSTWKKI